MAGKQQSLVPPKRKKELAERKPGAAFRQKKLTPQVNPDRKDQETPATPLGTWTHAAKISERLFDACREGDFTKVEEAVAEGADIRAVGTNGFTALHYACMSGIPTIVRFLLDRGAEVDKTENVNGCTPFLFAVRILTMPPDGFSVSMYHLEVAKMLLEAGANFDAKACDGKRGAIELVNERISRTLQRDRRKALENVKIFLEQERKRRVGTS